MSVVWKRQSLGYKVYSDNASNEVIKCIVNKQTNVVNWVKQEDT